MKTNNSFNHNNDLLLNLRFISDLIRIDFSGNLFDYSQSLNWPLIVRYLTDNRLAGLAYSKLLPYLDVIPEKYMRQLEQQFVANEFANVLLLQEAGRIFSSLKESGIDPIALKGIYLLEEIYQIGTRKLGDIDILIHGSEVEKAITVFENLGYRIPSQINHSKGCIDLYLTQGKHVIPVDLNWKFLHRSKFNVNNILSVDYVKKKCERTYISNVEVLVLDRIDQIIHIASHVVLHHELKFLPGLVDVYLLLTKSVNSIWKELECRSINYGLFRSVLTTIGVLNELFKLPVPEPLLNKWRALRGHLCKGPEVVFLDRAWIFGAENRAEVKSKRGGIRRNITRFYWRQTLCDSIVERASNLIDYLKPNDERIQKTYRVRSRLMITLFRLLHIPLFLMSSIIMLPFYLTLRPLYGLYLSSKIEARRII